MDLGGEVSQIVWPYKAVTDTESSSVEVHCRDGRARVGYIGAAKDTHTRFTRGVHDRRGTPVSTCLTPSAAPP